MMMQEKAADKKRPWVDTQKENNLKSESQILIDKKIDSEGANVKVGRRLEAEDGANRQRAVERRAAAEAERADREQGVLEAVEGWIGRLEAGWGAVEERLGRARDESEQVRGAWGCGDAGVSGARGDR